MKRIRIHFIGFRREKVSLPFKSFYVIGKSTEVSAKKMLVVNFYGRSISRQIPSYSLFEPYIIALYGPKVGQFFGVACRNKEFRFIEQMD